ncbi:[LysW]-lysine/[LysW]-ornithine hydrolase [uncultured archaeon]|nr:[LysW]-lysine/[LysW]-ornithine hydrolase [uncultured archaeon]
MTLPARRKFLLELVKTKSFSGHESAAALLCAQRMRELGYQHVQIDKVGNVVGGNYDYRKDPHPDLLLFSHMDTVGGFWLVKHDEQGVSGRGAVDAKGCLASYIEAGASMMDAARAGRGEAASGAGRSSASPPLKLVVAGVTREEDPTSEGANHLLSYLKPRLAVNGEPSNCSGVTLGYKGRILVECHSSGSPMHAGAHAENPIEKTIEYYEKLRAHFPRHHAFDSVIFNVTHIDYGKRSELNVIPGKLDFYIDVRIPPSADIAKIEHLFLSSAPAGLEVSIIKPSFPGCELSANHPLARALVAAIRSAKLEPRYLKKSGMADMNLSMALGIPTLAYGPGDSKLDHTDKEFISWADYEKAVEVLEHFLQNPALSAK